MPPADEAGGRGRRRAGQAQADRGPHCGTMARLRSTVLQLNEYASPMRAQILTAISVALLSVACGTGDGSGTDSGVDGSMDSGGSADGKADGEACSPMTCSQQMFNCGMQTDTCGGSLSCGTCPGNETCGGGGKPGVCCVPKTCGPQGCGMQSDGCGGNINCGTCQPPQTCGGGGPGVCG